MRKILITGGRGVLAGYVKKVFKDSLIFAPGHQVLDVTDEEAIRGFFKKNRPEVVIHLAAKTNVDECERKPREAFLVNSEGTKNIAEACKKHGAFLVYLSTAAVFNGRKSIFYENDQKNPLSVYGKSKSWGEKYIQEILPNFLIIRAGWMIGGGEKEKKFVSYIIRQAKEKRSLEVVDDKFGTVTYAQELADFVKAALLTKRIGVYHFGSKGCPSRFDIAREIMSLLKKEIKVIPVSSEKFENSFFAPRPKREVIGSKKIKYSLTWRESLASYFHNEIL